MKKFSAIANSNDLKDLFFYEDSSLDVSISESKIKFKNFKGLIHDPNGNRTHELTAKALKIDIDDSFILKSKVSEGISSDKISDNLSQINAIEKQISSLFNVDMEDIPKLTSLYINQPDGSINGDKARLLDRYVISLHSLPTSNVVLTPKNYQALKGATLNDLDSQIGRSLLQLNKPNTELTR